MNSRWILKKCLVKLPVIRLFFFSVAKPPLTVWVAKWVYSQRVQQYRVGNCIEAWRKSRGGRDLCEKEMLTHIYSSQLIGEENARSYSTSRVIVVIYRPIKSTYNKKKRHTSDQRIRQYPLRWSVRFGQSGGKSAKNIAWGLTTQWSRTENLEE